MKEEELYTEAKTETEDLTPQTENVENPESDNNKEETNRKSNLSEILSELKDLQNGKSVYEIRLQVNELAEVAKKIFEANKALALEDYLSKGGNEVDFFYENNDYSNFRLEFTEYKKNLKKYFEEKRIREQKNLVEKQSIIEELKNLYTIPSEDNKLLFDKYKELKVKWNNAGSIPKDSVQEVYKNYHHHLDNFFDFLDINNDLRNAYFQKNLEVRKSILEKTENLLAETNAKEMLRNLRFLHQSWKQDAVPVAIEHREKTWAAFKELSAKVRNRAEEILKNYAKESEEKLIEKRNLLELLATELEQEIPQKQKDRNEFFQSIDAKFEKFKAIDSPKNKETKELWAKFRQLSNLYYGKKNNFYKNLKKETNQNIQKKKELISIAKEHQESTDWENSLETLKNIQNDWKKIGFIPNKISNELWDEFKSTCDGFFERLKNKNNLKRKVEKDELSHKRIILDNLKRQKPSEINWEQTAKDWYKKSNSTSFDMESEFETLAANLCLDNKMALDLLDKTKQEVLSSCTSDENDLQWIEQQIQKSENLKKSYKTELTQHESSLAMFSIKSKENPLLINLKSQIGKEKLLLEREISYQKLLKTKLRELREESKEESPEEENA